MTDVLDVKCPFCGAEPGNGCVDPKTGQDYPTHRGRNILAMDIQDSPDRAAVLMARRDRIGNAVASVTVRQPSQAKPVPAQREARVVADEPPIALSVACSNCGAALGQPCVDPSTGEPKAAPCRVRKQAALGHSIEGV